MWGMWAGPLLVLWIAAALAGLLIALLWRWSRPAQRRASVLKTISVPIGCAVLPVVLASALVAILSASAKTDADYFLELFGEDASVGEERLIFDEFARGRSTQIFMEAQPGAQRASILGMAHLRPSRLSLRNFIAEGESRGLSWWLTSQEYGATCRRARMSEAPGFHGWDEFYVAECLDGGNGMFGDLVLRSVYIFATKTEQD